MQQDNNIENKLRELEEGQQPDLSNMDAHWQQMQVMLQPGAVAVKKGLPKWIFNGLSVLTVVVLIGAAMWFLSSKKNNNAEAVVKQNEVAPKENSTAVSTASSIIKDTLAKETVTPVVLSINPSLIYDYASQGNADTDAWIEEDSLLGTVKLNYTPCATCPDKKDEQVVSNAERQLRLQNLFTTLKKEEQHFTIDNSRDTLLQFEEGTVLLIPANSLGGKNGIVFTVKEFYKESDMILNQLSTASNKDQLVSGGMFQIKATLDSKEVNIDSSKPIRLYMADSSSNMNEMQLFIGETSSNHLSNISTHNTGDNIGSKTVNWLPQLQKFSNKKLVTQVRVLNLADMPYHVKRRKNGEIGYFDMDYSRNISIDRLKEVLKQKYGYSKVRLRHDLWYFTDQHIFYRYYDSYYGERIGDSLWMEKELADKYKLVGTATRTVQVNGFSNNANYRYYLDRIASQNDNRYAKLIENIKTKYSVDIKKFGWINCDRFYNDSREKIQYAVNLGDSAKNYYTVLVFDKIKSMMNGYVDGNRVIFSNLPKGEKVKIISIGIDKKGAAVYTLQPATINTEELSGLQFQSTSAAALKTELSKMDR